MTAELKEIDGGNVLEVQLTGTLVKEDYEVFVPAVERMAQEHGKIRVLVEMHEFHGWTAGAGWEDVKFGWKHFNDIERLAIVGETRWEQAMAAFWKPFTKAQVRYFDHVALDEARAWIAS